MTKPNKNDILEKATELWRQDRFRNGVPTFEITPEPEELRQEGFLLVAQRDLMRNTDHYKAYLEKELSDKNNESVDSSFTLAQLLEDIKNHLGIILVAEAGHGKSYTAFSLVKEAMKQKDVTVIIPSPSTIWRRRFGAIACVKVGTADFNPITFTDDLAFEPIPIMRDAIFINLDKKWIYQKTS